MSVNGTTSTTKRRTRAEVAAMDLELLRIVREVAPATVRQVFYQAVVRGLVPKDQTLGYRVVQRRLLILREKGVIPYRWITDNGRTTMRRIRYKNLQEYAADVAKRYFVDYWQDSEVRVEI